ncbi:MAG TPA: TetR/AcrR family transcriptional regulator [bacterium]|nr:TetR/AcrR family transcriptional regulator [bacterium]
MDIIKEKDEQVRQAILQAALRVFQKWGLNKTTMEDIAREAGKGKSTLYYYYKSKDEIFDAVLKIQLNNILSKAEELANSMSSAKEKLKKYIVSCICEMGKYSTIYSIARREINMSRGYLEKIRSFLEEREEKFIRQVLNHGFLSSEFHFIDEDELETAIKAIVGVIHALELYLMLENDDPKQIDIVARLITNGI